MSMAYLIPEQVKIRNQLLIELITGRQVLTEHDDSDQKQLSGGISICISRINLFCNKLEAINEKLSLGIEGTEEQNKFEQEMNTDFELMDVATDMYNELYYLENSSVNIKTKEENSSMKQIRKFLTKSIE